MKAPSDGVRKLLRYVRTLTKEALATKQLPGHEHRDFLTSREVPRAVTLAFDQHSRLKTSSYTPTIHTSPSPQTVSTAYTKLSGLSSHATRPKGCHRSRASSPACRLLMHSFRHRKMSGHGTYMPHLLSSDCQQSYRRLWWNM